MDTSRMSRGQMVAAAGGIVLIIALFLHWDDAAGQSAWDVFSGMDIIMLIIGVAAIAYGVLPALGSASVSPSTAKWVVFVLGVVAVGWALGWDLEDPSAGFGAWLGLFAALAIAIGAHEPTWIAQHTVSHSAPATSPPPPPPPPTAPPAGP